MDVKMLNLINNNVSSGKAIKETKINQKKNNNRDFSKVLNKSSKSNETKDNIQANREDNKFQEVKPVKNQYKDEINNKLDDKLDENINGLKKLNKLLEKDKSKKIDEVDLFNILELLLKASLIDTDVDIEDIHKKIEKIINKMFDDAINSLNDNGMLKNDSKINNLLNGIKKDAKQNLDTIINTIPVKKEQSQLLSNSLMDIENKVKNIIDKAINKLESNGIKDDEQFLNNVKEEILKVFAKEDKNIGKLNSSGDTKEKIYNILDKINMKTSENEAKSNLNNKDSNLLLGGDSKKDEESLLNNIAKGDNTDKFSKAINFANQFSNINKIDTQAVESTENLVINKQNIATDVVKAVKYMEVNNLKDLTVKINPKELGELVISVTMESGKMKANITANSKETFNLLNANIQDITDKLQNTDIRIQNFTLNLYEDTTFFKNKDGNRGENQYNSKNNNNKSLNAVEEIESGEEQNLLEELNNLSILA